MSIYQNTHAINNLSSDLLFVIMNYAAGEVKPSEVNSSIQAKARNLLKIMLVSKSMCDFFQERIQSFKERHTINIQMAERYRKPLVGLYPLLIEAAMQSDIDRFSALLRVEDVNQKDKFGRTALHIAVGINRGAGNIEFVRILLQHPDVDTSALTLKGKIAKDLTRNSEIAKLLDIHK